MKKLRLLTLFFCILAFTACDSIDFGDINQDDDAPQEASVEGLMAGAMNRYFSSLVGRSYHMNPTLYVQYQTQSVYTTEMRYGVNPYPWSAYYSGTLSNLSQVHDLVTANNPDPTLSAFGALNNQAAVAEIFSAMVWKRVTDTWGPVPYEEALQSESNKFPAYSDQETIYKDLISRVKAARDMITPSDPGPSGDVLYGGNMANWERFANSLLLSLSIQLSEADAGYAQTEFNNALSHPAGVIETLGQEAWYDHQNTSGATNPFTANRRADYLLAEPFTDALQAKTPSDSAITYSNDGMVDERINVLSSDPTATGAPYGTDNGGLSGPSISGTIWSSTADLHYMTAAYTYLNRAEAAERGWTTENAATMLENGIEMSYATFDGRYDGGNDNDDVAEVPQPDFGSGDLQSNGSAYATQRIADATTAPGGMLQVIGEEKWVALYPMGFQAWAEWRRTGYPGLKPAPDATNPSGNIPTRYIYPSVEGGVNNANYEEGVQMLTPAEDQNTSTFWWDQ